MSRQKRYGSEREIQNEINRCKQLAAEALAEAEVKEREIKEGKEYIAKFNDSKNRDERNMANWWVSQIPSIRLLAMKAAKRGNNYNTRVNTVLKDVLARFRTNMLPMERNEDVGVVE